MDIMIKRFCSGVLIMGILVLGMAATGCGGGDKNNLSKANPGETMLINNYGLTLQQFNSIIDAAAGGYMGWEINNAGHIRMVWSGRSISNFSSTADILDYIFGEWGRENEGGQDKADGFGYILVFNQSGLSVDGSFVPAGTLMAFIFRI